MRLRMIQIGRCNFKSASIENLQIREIDSKIV